jgi:hypothetical protein
MFAFFANSVGVANLARFQDLAFERPKYLAAAESGAGFAQLARHILLGR